jgi:acetyl/propionyl-CoA carboxylase alpha subunit
MKSRLALVAVVALISLLAAPGSFAQTSPTVEQKKQREAYELRKAETERRAEEQAKARAEKIQNRDLAEEEFRRATVLEARIYQLRNAKAVMVEKLVRADLKLFYLQQDSSTDEYRIRSTSAADPVLAPTPGILARVEERVFADTERNAVIVMATDDTQKKISKLVAEWDGPTPVAAEPNTEHYRLEISLLQGGKAGESVDAPGRQVRLSFPVTGIIEKLAVKPGARVKGGDLIAALDAQEAEIRLKQAALQVDQFMSRVKRAEQGVERLKELVKTGVQNQEALDNAVAALESAKNSFERGEMEVQQARNQLRYYTMQAPEPGTISAVAVNPHERVQAGQVVVGFVPESGAKETTGSLIDPKLPQRFGLSAEDLKLFNLTGVAELGSAVLTLAAQKGEEGRVAVSLAEGYRCELEFIALREPFLVARCRLFGKSEDPVGRAEEKPLLENTLFLEKSKPTILGLTNLRQALILVVRVRDAEREPAASGPARTPASAPQSPGVPPPTAGPAPKAR